MLIGLQELGKSFGERVILHGITASVEKEDRIGIIGENGAGKTTLIRMLCGEYTPDEGEMNIGDNVTIGYLEQNAHLDPALDVYGEMRTVYAPAIQAMEKMHILDQKLAADPANEAFLAEHGRMSAIVDAMDAYNMDVEIRKVLNGMDFGPATYEKSVGVLSGGELTRLRLAKLLLQKPDVLILDEPTNHLDFATMEWLESYLKEYRGAVLVVSHDRYFLDSICNRIWEVEQGTLIAYKGNFSAYLPQKEMAVALQQKQHDADVAKAAKLEDYIARNLVRASTTKMAQSRRKQLEKLEITEAPKTGHTEMNFRFEFDVAPYNEVLITKQLHIEIGGRDLLHSLDQIVYRGDKLVIAGPNGAGKSTLLQVLDGRRRPSSGLVRTGAGTKASIFEQQIRRGGRVIDAIWSKYPRFTELEVRSHLARFAFRGEDVFKPCDALSGGELARLRFAEMVLERPNLLFLDEPTNHLDIFTRESLTQALAEYEGTLLLVTHDRYLMNTLGCPILYLQDGEAKLYESYEKLMGRGTAPVQPVKQESTAGAQNQGGGYGKEERRRRAEARNRLKTIEKDIDEVGARIVELENEMNDPEVYRDHNLMREKCDALEDARFHQQELFDEWEKLLEEQDAQEEAAKN